MDPTSPRPADPCAALLDWLAREGAEIARVGLDFAGDSGRGAIARAPIHSGEVVMAIPRRLLLTREVARASPIRRPITGSGVDLRSSHTYLAAFLLHERAAPSSPFRPYIDALPTSLRHMPILFDDHELALLKGSLTLPWIQQRRASLRTEYEALRRAVPGFARFSLLDFVWARLCVVSRVFGITVEGTKTEALVPLGDMLNHKRPRETEWAYDDARGAFVVTALRDFAPGDQVNESYGRKCNSRFFVNYGFALDDNESNEAAIPILIPSNAPCRARKLARVGGPFRIFEVPAGFGTADAADMFSFLRFAVADDAEMAKIADLDLDAIGLLGPRNEAAALRLLAASCEAALARFDTSIDEDDALLQRPDLSANHRNAIVQRRGEKRILHGHLDLARKAEQLLALPKAAARSAIAEGRLGDPHDPYVENILLRLVAS